MSETFFRPYLRTHPWITFKADLRPAPAGLWVLLGEARSKCEHVSGVPLPSSVARKLNQLYLAKGVHATTAIEGNTLTEEEVERHIEGKLSLPESRDYLKQEVDNLIGSFNGIVASIHENGPSTLLSSELICRFNADVLRGLSLDADTIPGKIRKHSVGVGRYRGAPAEDCEFLLAAMCRWLNEAHFDSDNQLGLAAAVLKAVLAHLYIAWIHPFGDGNGRTARLVEFYLLVNAGVPVPSAHLLSDHYNQTRLEYYRQLDHASASHGDVIPFILYAVQGFVAELKQQLDHIRQQQWTLAWKDFIDEQFGQDGSATRQRQKDLLLDLSAQAEPTPKNRLVELSPRVARAYARKTEKTLDRDVAALVEAGLIVREKAGLRVRKELILAFLPPAWAKKGSSLPGG